MRSKIRLDNNSYLEAGGAGNMVIKRSNGKSTIIGDVLYVPSMNCNLLNVRQLIENVFSVIIENVAF